MHKMKWVMPEYLRRNLDRYKYVLLVCALGLLLTLWPQGKKEETAATVETTVEEKVAAKAPAKKTAAKRTPRAKK